MKSMFSSALVSSHRPKTLFAAAKIEHRLREKVFYPWKRAEQHSEQPVKGGGDAGLGNGDGLLLHGLVDRHPVVLAHLVELIDAHHPTICQNHGASLQQKTSSHEILAH